MVIKKKNRIYYYHRYPYRAKLKLKRIEEDCYTFQVLQAWSDNEEINNVGTIYLNNKQFYTGIVEVKDIISSVEDFY